MSSHPKSHSNKPITSIKNIPHATHPATKSNPFPQQIGYKVSEKESLMIKQLRHALEEAIEEN